MYYFFFDFMCFQLAGTIAAAPAQRLTGRGLDFHLTKYFHYFNATQH